MARARSVLVQVPVRAVREGALALSDATADFSPRAIALLAALVLLATPGPTWASEHEADAGAEDSDAQRDDEMPRWIPSMWFGLGAAMREVAGSVEGTIHTGTGTSDSRCDANQFCTFSASNTVGINSITVPIGLQLMGPAWSSLKSRPRLFLQGGMSFPLNDRLVVSDGFKVSDFDSITTQARVRIELRSEPQWIWFAGLGAAFELPVDLGEHQRVWVKLSANYFEEKFDLVGSVTQLTNKGPPGPDGLPLFTVNTTNTGVETLRIAGVGPGIGIEALWYEVGGLSVGFALDFLVSFNIRDYGTEFDVEAQGFGNSPPDPPGSVTYTYGAGDHQYHAFATLRFSWTGR